MGLTKAEALHILGLEDGSTEREIRDRFKKLALKWHPDKNLHDPDEAQKKFQAVSAAYTRLVASEETDDTISTETLGEMFAEIWEQHNKGHHSFDPHAHIFCDCEICHQEWEGVDYGEILGSDSEFEDDMYYGKDDGMYADHLLKEFADRLYRNFNDPGRMMRRARGSSSWEGSSVYSKKRISAEEASKNASELLQAEEEEKKKAEKRRMKNKKKKEAKKKRKIKKQSKPQSNSAVASGEESGEEEEEGAKESTKNVRATQKHDFSDEEDENEFDITSAFVARASKKQAQQVAKGKTAPPSSAGSRTVAPNSHEYKLEQNTELQSHSSSSVSSDSSSSRMDGVPPVPNYHSKTPAVNMSPKGNISKATVYEPNVTRSRQLASQGNRAAKDGHFEEAVRKYTDAIELYPFDHRYFGNRSFCYDYLHEYTKALQDANTSLELDSNWPKGYYRKGRALAGLKRYEEAEKSYVKAVQLDSTYKDAEEELFKMRSEQLENMGFPSSISEVAIREYKTVQAAVDGILAGNVQAKLEVENYQDPHTTTPPPVPMTNPSYVPVFNSSGFQIPPRMLNGNGSQLQTANTQGRALWVGNITSKTVTQEMVTNLFSQYGDIDSVRMLPNRHCAFVNYTRPECAAQALKGLQGYNLGGCYLLLRYPENPTRGAAKAKAKKSGPVNGDECYFWRTTGCSFGSSCRYKHVPQHRGVDLTDSMLQAYQQQY